MGRGESLLTPLVQKLTRRSAQALLGDALLLGLIWIVLDAGMQAWVQARMRSIAGDMTMPDLTELSRFLALAGIVEFITRACGIVAMGLLIIGAIRLHADLTARPRQG